MIQFIDGNRAVVLGALEAGCNFFAGYPITPATQILVDMIELMPKHEGIGIQAEDEIAAIGFCLGAVMNGAKALTATSGPGMSLYSENLGMAQAGELPLVIINCQRLGPSTGSATKDASGDIQFARWGTSAGTPIISLCPKNVEECFTFTIEAFNLAEKYRTPVILLLSKDLAQTSEVIDFSKIKLPKIINRKYFNLEEIKDKTFKPYLFNKGKSIAPFLPYGSDQAVRFTTSSHKEDGFLATTPTEIKAQIDHLENKISEKKIHKYKWIKNKKSQKNKILIVSYGVVSRSVEESIELLNKEKIYVDRLNLSIIWPFPKEKLSKIFENYKTIIVPEMNNGQILIECEKCILNKKNIKIIPLQKMDSNLISPMEILNLLKGKK